MYSYVSIFLGESCTIISTGQPGTCKTILSCPAALEEIKRQKFPQTCGFDGSVPRVCCAGAAPSQKTTTTTQRTTTTTRTTPRTRTTPKATTNFNVNPYRRNEPGYKSYESE